MKLTFLLLGAGLLACREPFCEDKPDQTAGLVVRHLEKLRVAYDAQRGEDLGRFGIRISTAEQYERVFARCCAGRLDTLDFTRYEILGLSTVNRGSNSGYRREVTRDDATRKITFTVHEDYCRRSSPVDGQGNFVLVPKLPADYTVEYRRDQ